jgi:AcrR family transcriptional regulator
MSRLSTEERQDMIIDEAIKIIHAGGYQSFSIRELAKSVKISEPAIYRHFLNKEDIILGIMNRMLDFDYLLEKELLTKKTAKVKIKHFVLFHFEFLEKNYEMTSVLFAEDIFNQSEILKNRLKFIIQKRKSLLKSIIDETHSDGEIVDVDIEDLLTIILGTIRLTVLEWRLSGFNFSLVERGKKILKTLDGLIFIKK